MARLRDKRGSKDEHEQSGEDELGEWFDEAKRQKWFSPSNRESAEKILLDIEADGAFLVRECSRPTNRQPFTLSVYFSGEVIHIKICRTKLNKWAVGEEGEEGKTFSSLNELIKFHKETPMLIRDPEYDSQDLLLTRGWREFQYAPVRSVLPSTRSGTVTGGTRRQSAPEHAPPKSKNGYDVADHYSPKSDERTHGGAKSLRNTRGRHGDEDEDEDDGDQDVFDEATDDQQDDDRRPEFDDRSRQATTSNQLKLAPKSNASTTGQRGPAKSTAQRPLPGSKGPSQAPVPSSQGRHKPPLPPMPVHHQPPPASGAPPLPPPPPSHAPPSPPPPASRAPPLPPPPPSHARAPPPSPGATNSYDEQATVSQRKKHFEAKGIVFGIKVLDGSSSPR